MWVARQGDCYGGAKNSSVFPRSDLIVHGHHFTAPLFKRNFCFSTKLSRATQKKKFLFVPGGWRTHVSPTLCKHLSHSRTAQTTQKFWELLASTQKKTALPRSAKPISSFELICLSQRVNNVSIAENYGFLRQSYVAPPFLDTPVLYWTTARRKAKKQPSRK